MAAHLDYTSISIISYNLFGLGQGKSLLSDLTRDYMYKIIFVQEHWQTPANMHKILNFNENFTGYGISAMEGTVSKGKLRGRSFGGVCSLVHNSLVPRVKCLQCADRFVIITFGSTIFINVYLPSYSIQNGIIIQSILSEIGDIIALYPNHSVVLGGDLNTDMSISSSACQIIKSFMVKFKLKLCTDIYAANCKYTFHKDTQQHFSFIDYFMVSENVAEQVWQFKVIDHLVNLSDHMPITISVGLPIGGGENIRTNMHAIPAEKQSQHRRLRWDLANLQHYYATSYEILQPLVKDVSEFYSKYVEPMLDPSNLAYMNYNGSMCSNIDEGLEGLNYSHRSELSGIRQAAIKFIETSYEKLTKGLETAANLSVPRMGRSTLKHWWNDELANLKQRAFESHTEWVVAGKPKAGLIAEVMKSEKYTYKLAIRKYKLAESKGVSDSLLESLHRNDSNSFWQVWRSKLGVARSLPKVVNGECDQKIISESFATHFANACSNNSEVRSRQLQTEYLSKKKTYKRYYDLRKFILSDEEVFNFISKLKRGKAPGLDNLTAEHLQNAHHIIINLITKLFNIMLCFEYVPDEFGRGILIPIPKITIGANDVKTNDYRGISLNPIISKLFEQAILVIFDKYLGSSSMQLGFKSKSSCSHALFSVRKTIEFFVERQSTVNVCGLDLAKAFDKMNRYGLFIKLMNRGCPILLINILDVWYSKAVACVRWGDCVSRFVSLHCGTRQGGVASPILFAVCINDIIDKLQKSSLGCHIHSMCFNAYMYADDLILLATSLADLQKMIDICKMELDWLDMVINAKKSGCIRIGLRFDVVPAKPCVGSDPIEWVSELQYLGVMLKSAKSFKCALNEKKGKFYRSLNGLLGKLGSDPPINVVLSLISTNCNPILLYCLEALKFTKKEIKSLSYPYNSAFMKLFNTFNSNTIAQCQFYCGVLPFEYLLNVHTLNFYDRLKQCKRSPANILYTWFGDKDFDSIASKYSIGRQDNPNQYKVKIWNTFSEFINNIE
jgi:exonuclease III